jgi:hypothetical protein
LGLQFERPGRYALIVSSRGLTRAVIPLLVYRSGEDPTLRKLPFDKPSVLLLSANQVADEAGLLRFSGSFDRFLSPTLPALAQPTGAESGTPDAIESERRVLHPRESSSELGTRERANAIDDGSTLRFSTLCRWEQLPAGRHEAQLELWDEAGNVLKSYSESFTIDAQTRTHHSVREWVLPPLSPGRYDLVLLSDGVLSARRALWAETLRAPQPATQHELRQTGQAPNLQELGETGQAPNLQELGETGQAPNLQEEAHDPD